MRFISLGLLLAASTSTALAGSVTIGGPAASENCIPFGCPAMFGISEYQEVYSGSAFPGPVQITELTFFNTFATYPPESTTITPATYVFWLSTTSKPVGGLSNVLTDNIGGDDQYFATISGSALATPELTIPGGPFAFDPAAGNLLLRILVSGVGTESFIFMDSDADPSSDTQRAYSPGGHGWIWASHPNHLCRRCCSRADHLAACSYSTAADHASPVPPPSVADAVTTMAATLDHLKVADVAPKPVALAEELRNETTRLSLDAAMSLRQRGFVLSATGRLLANEAEVVVETSGGLIYLLRFGEVATGRANIKPATGTGENCHLLVTVNYDPARAAKYGDSSGSGERLAKDLTKRYAGWYYVINNGDSQKLRLKSQDVIR
jgi:hypothetical protein